MTVREECDLIERIACTLYADNAKAVYEKIVPICPYISNSDDIDIISIDKFGNDKMLIRYTKKEKKEG